MDTTRLIGISGGIEPKHDVRDLSPVRAIGVGVEEAQIGDGMAQVVVGDLVRRRWCILKRWSTRCHSVSSQPEPPQNSLG